jgi:hypothetical protein
MKLDDILTPLIKTFIEKDLNGDFGDNWRFLNNDYRTALSSYLSVELRGALYDEVDK